MKKADLVDVVAQQKNLPRQQVEITVDALIEAVAEGLAKGERIDLRGFGAFAVRESAARKGRNPQTGADDPDRSSPRTDLQGRQGAARQGEQPSGVRIHARISAQQGPKSKKQKTDGYSTLHRQPLVRRHRAGAARGVHGRRHRAAQCPGGARPRNRPPARLRVRRNHDRRRRQGFDREALRPRAAGTRRSSSRRLRRNRRDRVRAASGAHRAPVASAARLARRGPGGGPAGPRVDPAGPGGFGGPRPGGFGGPPRPGGGGPPGRLRAPARPGRLPLPRPRRRRPRPGRAPRGASASGRRRRSRRGRNPRSRNVATGGGTATPTTSSPAACQRDSGTGAAAGVR